jgi:hypothetical protein
MSAKANQLAKLFEKGARLAETPMGITESQSLTEATGWKEMLEGIEDESRKPFVALMLENYKEYRQGLDETTTTLQVGNYDKFAFPMLSIVAENLIAQELVSVQPLEGPSGLIFYMNFTTGQAKGAVPKGATIWDAKTGHVDRYQDSNDRVENEAVGTTDASGDMTANLSYTPVQAGTVAIVMDSVTVTDDGAGVLAGTNVTGTINYFTGAISINGDTGAHAGFGTVAVIATYNYSIELNPNAQQLDFEVVSSPIYAQERKLRGRWSTEAAQALEALHKINAENVVSTAIANQLQWEIDREIIEDLRRQAGAGLVIWDATIPSNAHISFTEHKLSFFDAITTASNFIYRATNRVKANWILCGIQAANILETLPMFSSSSENKAEVDGVSQLGKLGRYKVYVDPHYPINEALMGYKGNDFVRTGYIFAPWILLYSTPLVVLDDFVARKGFSSQYGKKVVNSKFYAKIRIDNYKANFGGSGIGA